MSRYGGTAASAEEVRATILDTTCDPTDIAAQYDSYYDLMPYSEKEPTLTKEGRFFAFQPIGMRFEAYYPKISVKGTANSYSYKSDDLPGGAMHVGSKGSIEKFIIDGLKASNLPQSYAHNICSYYIWYAYRNGEVHPDLLPYYQGDAIRWSLKGISDAEMRWAEAQRADLINKVAMQDCTSLLRAYRDNPPPVGKDGMAQWLANQEQQLSNDNSAYSDALEDIPDITPTDKDDDTSSDKEPSILPKVGVSAVTAVAVFGILMWRNR